MKIALVGGHGFVGHHLALKLKASGHEPVVIDSLSVNNQFTVDGNRELLAMCEERADLLELAGVPRLHVDVRQARLFNRLTGSLKPEAIVHLAAVAHIDRSNKDPASTFEHSLVTLAHSLELARAVECRHFVYFSSSTAYGDFKKPIVDETEPCSPRGIYGTQKLAGEWMVRGYGDIGLPYTIIRPCALYGPRCVSGRVTQKFVEMAHNGQTIRIDGDGEGRHDFTSVYDLIDGVARVLNRPPHGETYNITAGEARSVNELVAIIRRGYPEMRVEHGPSDPEKPSRGTMSVKKAYDLLGYEPQWSLERGMADYIDWYKGFRAGMERRAA